MLRREATTREPMVSQKVRGRSNRWNDDMTVGAHATQQCVNALAGVEAVRVNNGMQHVESGDDEHGTGTSTRISPVSGFEGFKE